MKDFNNKRFYNPRFKNQPKVNVTKNKYHTSIGPADLFFSVLYTEVPNLGSIMYNDIQCLDLKRYLLYLIRQYDKHKNLLYLDLMNSDVLLEIKKYGSDKILHISPKNLRINLLYIFYYYEMERNSVKTISKYFFPERILRYSSNYLNIQYTLEHPLFQPNNLITQFFNNLITPSRPPSKTISDCLIHFKLDNVVMRTKIKDHKSIYKEVLGFSMGPTPFFGSISLLRDSIFQDFSILSDIVYQTDPKTLDKMVPLLRKLL